MATSGSNRSEPLSVSYLLIRGKETEDDPRAIEEEGGWGVSSNRAIFGWGMVRYEDWPIDPSPSIFEMELPPELNQLAKSRRNQFYVRAQSAEQCDAFARNRLVVTADIKVTASWRHPKDGKVIYDPNTEGILGSHCIGIFDSAIAPISLPPQHIFFSNSWGAEWGIHGYGVVSHSDLDNMLLDAWAAEPGRPIQLAVRRNRSHSLVLTTHHYDAPECGRVHVIQLTDTHDDDRLGWVMAVERGGSLHADDLYVKKPHRRQGFGLRLLNEFLHLANRLGLRPQLWIPFPDWHPSVSKGLVKFFAKKNLFIDGSPERWAAALVTRERSTGELPGFTAHQRPQFSLLQDQRKREQTPIPPKQVTLDVHRQRWYEPKKPFEEVVEQVLEKRRVVLRRLAQ